MRVLVCLSALALAVPVFAQSGDEVRKLKERIDQLETENEALKALIAKLKRDGKGGDGGADAKAVVDRFCTAMRSPDHAIRLYPKQDNGTWSAVWYEVVVYIETKELKKTDSLLNPIVAQLEWTTTTVNAGPFATEAEAKQAAYPKKSKDSYSYTYYKGSVAIRDGKPHLVALSVRSPYDRDDAFKPVTFDEKRGFGIPHFVQAALKGAK